VKAFLLKPETGRLGGAFYLREIGSSGRFTSCLVLLFLAFSHKLGAFLLSVSILSKLVKDLKTKYLYLAKSRGR
jgi:hypothetical protein